MATCPDSGVRVFQRWFHERWGHLNDPHVRALAWLLEAPGLLAFDAPQWKGKVGALHLDSRFATQWLGQLDAQPQELHAWLSAHAFYRLGRYAERLMSFYFRREGSLLAHGMQLRGRNQETIGEFDFLLRRGESILHLELATKFYLLNANDAPTGHPYPMDYFIGPNLADTLGLKMRKIIEKQLMLGQHPAARAELPYSIDVSQALVKGWLFYPDGECADPTESGLSKEHCKGFWCTTSALAERSERHYLILPRLRWLAPAKVGFDQVMEKERLVSHLIDVFRQDRMPVLVAIVAKNKDFAVEIERGFIVPDDWQTRAGHRNLPA